MKDTSVVYSQKKKKKKKKFTKDTFSYNICRPWVNKICLPQYLCATNDTFFGMPLSSVYFWKPLKPSPSPRSQARFFPLDGGGLGCTSSL